MFAASASAYSHPIHDPMDEFQKRLLREIPDHLRGGRADISVYRDIVGRHEALLCATPEMPKDNAMATYFRREGNRIFAEQDHFGALECYNESICYAETESEELGLAYACRSAVYEERGEYEYALYNIDLARKHNYPERLQHKLMALEDECKRMIELELTQGVIPHPMADINIEVNQKIPFLAKGIVSAQPGTKGMVSERDFNVGDVILDEKIDLCMVLFKARHSNCAHCSSAFLSSLIPCPGCVTVMYCGEKCREQDFRTVHRFECSVATKLWSVTKSVFLVSAKFFFYGLTAFNDNVDAMMEYCLSNVGIGSNPLDLDFTKPNALDVFKVLHQTKTPSGPKMMHTAKTYAALYHMIFLKNPLVKSIFRTEAQRDFLLRCLLTHGLLAISDQWTSSVTCIQNCFNRSCDPNLMVVKDSGRSKLIVIRPIKPGDELLHGTSTTWWYCHSVATTEGCQCVVCGPQAAAWRASYDQDRPISPELDRDLAALKRGEMDIIAELTQHKCVVERMAREGHHPSKLFGNTLDGYWHWLRNFVRDQNMKRDRAMLLEMRGDEIVPSWQENV